jgi:hypothetical protein
MKQKHMRWWQRILLILAGTLLGLVMIVVLLSLMPQLMMQNAAQSRSQGNTTMDVEFRHTLGNLFDALPGRIRPPAEDTVLARFTIAWDADGFRVPAQTADIYPIAAFGDSFTEGTLVPVPWADRLAEVLNVPVQNYGYRSYGPLEIQETVHEFVGKSPRQWVLYAFFAGNEMSDANRTTRLEERSPLYTIPQLAQEVGNDMSTRVASQQQEHYDFPMPVIIGGNYYEMAFLMYYLWGQRPPAEGFAASRTYQVFEAALDAIQADAGDACLGLIFVPTKEQLYYPYIIPSERQWLRQNAYQQMIDDSGLLQIIPQPLSADDEARFMAEDMQGLHHAVAATMQNRPDWHFIDLLPLFEEHVALGELLYYPYDTHWNQAGHDLAAQAIADSLQQVPTCLTA